LPAEEDGVDVVVLPVAPLKDAGPELLDAVDDSDDAAILSLVCILSGPAGRVDVARSVAASDLLIVERSELTEASTAVRQQRDQYIDDEPDEAEPTAADSDPTRADAAPASVRYLAWIKWCVAPKAHAVVSCLLWRSANTGAKTVGAVAR